ncbi:MAG: hypothetical protein Q4D45_08900 [Lachnospiraceae bacterium]|nr:hypothetical protein [Lachnospiraceae bacterium]
MSEKDIVLRKYLSDNEKFSDLINGIAFGGNNIIDTKMIEEKNTVLAYHKTDKVLKRERDIIKKIQTLIQSNTRYRYLSEETFEVFVVLSDERASIKQLKKYVAYNQNGKVAYDMCRAFDQLREEGRQQGRLEGRQQAEHKLNQLYATLVAQKRFDDLEKATSDEKFRQELYQEIQLSY